MNMITVQSDACAIHDSYIVSVNFTDDVEDWVVEASEGALEGYVNALDCTVCAAESINLDVKDYVGLFVERFLPLITTIGIPKPSVRYDDVKKRLSYG